MLFKTQAIDADVLAQLAPEQLGELAEIADFRYMNGLRDRNDSIVDDPDVAEKLKGWYGQWCKRPIFNDDYHKAFNQPNVRWSTQTVTVFVR